TIILLPPKCPELNPVENVWQFMRDNWLSNRIFKSYDDLVDHCCAAWNKLVDQPWRIMSIGLRQWAHGFSSMGFGITNPPFQKTVSPDRAEAQKTDSALITQRLGRPDVPAGRNYGATGSFGNPALSRARRTLPEALASSRNAVT